MQKKHIDISLTHPGRCLLYLAVGAHISELFGVARDGSGVLADAVGEHVGAATEFEGCFG